MATYPPRPGHRRTPCDGTESSAAGAPTTREQRGLELYREHASEIVFERGVWLVPSQHDSTSVYEVSIGRRGESCECADFGRSGATCKHIICATIARAKTAPCSGCGERFPRRDLVEVHAEHVAAGHGVREGERYCRPCAVRAAGVA